MSEALIVKVEIVKGPRPKQELVTIHSHDRIIDVKRPLDEMTQSFLGKNFKGYFKARFIEGKLVLLQETSWTEWNKGRFHS